MAEPEGHFQASRGGARRSQGPQPQGLLLSPPDLSGAAKSAVPSPKAAACLYTSFLALPRPPKAQCPLPCRSCTLHIHSHATTLTHPHRQERSHAYVHMHVHTPPHPHKCTPHTYTHPQHLHTCTCIHSRALPPLELCVPTSYELTLVLLASMSPHVRLACTVSSPAPSPMTDTCAMSTRVVAPWLPPPLTLIDPLPSALTWYLHLKASLLYTLRLKPPGGSWGRGRHLSPKLAHIGLS